MLLNTCLAPPWKYTWCRNVDSAWYSFMPGQKENIAKHKTRDYLRIRQNCRDPYNISSPGFMVLMTCMWARLEILLAYLSTSSSIGVLITRHSAIVLNNIVIRAVKYKQTFAKLHSARWSVKLIAETREETSLKSLRLRKLLD